MKPTEQMVAELDRRIYICEKNADEWRRQHIPEIADCSLEEAAQWQEQGDFLRTVLAALRAAPEGIRQLWKPLENLYTLTEEEWVLEIHHILTEPVCPSVMIYPESDRTKGVRVDESTIEEGIQKAVELTIAALRGGKEPR